VLTALQARIENLEAEVDDLNRLTTALREETENLQQRLDAEQGGFRTGEGS
jgi:chaperonin cofactor prefoldin